MNKIRGSIVAKLIAWILCISCALGTVVFGLLTVVGIEEGYFGMKREEVLEDAYKSINAVYSSEAYQNMKYHRAQRSLAEEGFRFGIFQTENLAKVDFKDKKYYIDTNMTDEDFQNMDINKLYLYQIREYAGGGNEGSFYGCVSDWDNLSDLQSITGHLAEQDQTVWKNQYADAVCFDTTKGIFYYRSDDYYYPVQNVELYYTNDWGIDSTFYYIYDFEAGKYRLDYYNNEYEAGDYPYNYYDVVVQEASEQSIGEFSATSVEDSIESALKGDEAEHYVDFAALNKYQLGYTMWELLILDNVRQIVGEELTIIDSKKIEEKYFVDPNATAYYLDDNYTLFVEQEVESAYYWIVSLIPDVSQPAAEGSKYQSAAVAIELFYKYGNNAYIFAIVFAVVTLVSFFFLVYACGYRKDREGIVLTWFDRIPLEILSAIAFFAEMVPFSIASLILDTRAIRNKMELSIFILLAFSVVVGFCMIALWYVLGLCVRLKYGKWWRNTICYKICSFLWKTVKNLFDNIALLWKLNLFVIVKALIELFVMAACGVDGEMVFLWLVETILLTVAAYYAVIQINELQKAAAKMADGNLGYKVHTEKMFSPIKMHGNNLNKIGEGLSKAVDERMKSERFKTELITNVSHDIKTPLTSIINYVDLLEKEELHNEKAEEYLDVLERQSSKLKKLIEDLVEASKASTGNLEVGHELLEAGVFLTQTVGEFEDKLSLSGLELIVKKPETPIYISADGRHLWRVVDNLMSNICKYAQPSSRVYVNLEKEDKTVAITFRNISKYQLNINGDELLERFIRGDSSRNTEGHGLGLSIAKSLMDLMGGGMKITVDGDLFKVRLDFPVQEGAEELLRQHEEDSEGTGEE